MDIGRTVRVEKEDSARCCSGGMGMRFVMAAAGFLLSTLLMTGVAGCGLFSTRDPEPPTSGSSSFTPPTSPDIVLSNLEHAVAEKNAENYVRCLVDTLNSERRFAFTPTAAAAGRYPSTFLNWSLQSERSYFSSLLALTPKEASTSLTVSGGFTVLASDSAMFTGTYSMSIPHGVNGIATTVRGTVQFLLAPNRNSLWGIVEWIDTPLANETSWSEWKGRFAN